MRVAEIVLRRSPFIVALIDDADLPTVSGHFWRAELREGRTPYAITNRPGTKNGILKMHRLLMNAPDGVLVDHINGNGLDNRRENLRLCDHLGNSRNAKAIVGSSRFKGVHFNACNGRWEARIRQNGRQKCLGYYDSEEEAARVYDAAAAIEFGEFARFNFPASTPDAVASSIAAARLSGAFSPKPARGVYWRSRRQKWEAALRIDGKWRSFGHYVERGEAEAALRRAKEEIGYVS